MKKLLAKFFVIAITFIMVNISLLSLPLEQLGDFRSSEIIGYNFDEGRWITIFYFQFGMVTRGLGEDIIYFYGQEDLPGTGKRNLENFANINEENYNDDIHIYVYEANDIANPNPAKYKIVKGDVGYQLQNLNLNLERGRLYLIVFRDKSGRVLEVNKVILAD